MKSWQYNVVVMNVGEGSPSRLDDLGSQGWELVQVIVEPDRKQSTWIFKRPTPGWPQ